MAIRKSLVSLAALALAGLATAQFNAKPFKLMVGDSPPALTVSKWIKGTPVKEFEKGKVYVVEFWATWCGPCKVSIPHITELQKKVGDKAQFIGVSVWESKDTLPTVEKFVEEWGAKMDYTIAMDKLPEGADQGRDGAMALSWMRDSGAPGIPTAFIIDKDSKVAWIGHPMTIDKPLEQVIDGTWDANAYAIEYSKGKEKDAKMAAANKKVADAIKAKDWGAAFEAVDEMAAGAGYPEAFVISRKFNILFMNKKDYDGAYAFARKNLDKLTSKEDAMTLNGMAWVIVDPMAKPEKMDLDLALAMATKSVELSDRKDWASLDTLARVHFLKGDKAKALEIQKEAISIAPDGDAKKSLEPALKEYGG